MASTCFTKQVSKLYIWKKINIMNRKTLYAILLPIAGVLLLLLGIAIGHFMFGGKARDVAGMDKIHEVMSLIDQQYVDTLDSKTLTDMALTSLLASLDPHSEYIPKEDLQAVNEDLDGTFSGVGISFQIVNDTVTIVEAITGGPAEKLGIMAGDRIIAANGKSLTGSDVSNEDVFSTLRGKKGTKVTLEIKRLNSPHTFKYEVIRNDIPVNSVDAAYIIDGTDTGYIKLSKFTRNTYMEFLNALVDLDSKGLKKLIIDLRGNPGGYMEQAILIANEFLHPGQKIVFTKSRTEENKLDAVADGTGSHQNIPLAIIINEYSASASEIIAGAIQDNDRGIVVGRRSFGKGLVQNQTMLPDSSAIRLTVARYYTPSGRSIQKEYKIGEAIDYDRDILDRYNRGEFFHLDSVSLDRTKKFRTIGGRTVYGGGGIMPDVFVPEDTVGVTTYYLNVSNGGLIQQFAFGMADSYRPLMKGVKKAGHALEIIPEDDPLIEEFAEFAEERGVPARWYYINISAELIANQIKSFVIRDLLGYNDFYEIFNRTDRTIQAAVEFLNEGKIPERPISR